MPGWSLFPLLSQATDPASFSGEAEAAKAICAVLTNIWWFMVMVVSGFFAVIFSMCLLAGAIVFALVKDEKPSTKLVRNVIKALLIAVPLVWLMLVAAIVGLNIALNGGRCPPII